MFTKKNQSSVSSQYIVLFNKLNTMFAQKDKKIFLIRIKVYILTHVCSIQKSINVNDNL